jgi:uncharacterized 2Fe-2S/4Fe-4S cluster protein (DUF4445 family)
MEKCKVTFYPDNKTVEVPKGETILAAALSVDIYLSSTCGGDGVCGRCKVLVKKGKVVSQPTGRVSTEEKEKGVHLACLTVIEGDVEIEILPQSRLDFEKISDQDVEARLRGLYSDAEEIEVTNIPKTVAYTPDPLTSKLHIVLPRPTLDDSMSDLERLYRQIDITIGFKVNTTSSSNIRRLGELLRDADWKVTVTIGRREAITELLLIEPGDTSKRNFGFAFDIGTTTISGQLVDLTTGKVLGTKATYNKQASFGGDVITRIIFAQKGDGLEKLHHAVIDTMNCMAHELIQEHHIDFNDVTAILCAGNTTMIHLLLKIDPTYIRREPYVPTVNFVPTLRASEAGIKINPRGILSCVSGVASYIGGDVTAGVLSSGLYLEEELSLLIDVGTNGEIVLGNKEFLIAASASAGPAFEGSGVACGMRASKGAIQKVEIDKATGKVNYATIANAPARGICGSGYIHLLAELLRTGLMDKSGKLRSSPRIRENSEGKEFVVAYKEETAEGTEDVVITEVDIENIKRAKGAIYAATASLIRHVGSNIKDIKKIFIAGGFGTFLDIESAICIGLLPDVERSRFIFIGNSSLAGAQLILLSSQAKEKAEEIAKKITCFELSVDPGYMDDYMAALFFPHTNLNLFPSFKG